MGTPGTRANFLLGYSPLVPAPHPTHCLGFLPGPGGRGLQSGALLCPGLVCQMPSSQTAKQQPLFWWENRDGYAGAHGSGRNGHTFLDSPAQGLQQPTVLQPLVSCPKLVLLHLQGNPLCQAVGASEHLAELLPSVNSILT